MLVGLLLYGYCLAVLASTLANVDAPRVRFLEKIIAMKYFMVKRDISPKLQTRVSIARATDAAFKPVQNATLFEVGWEYEADSVFLLLLCYHFLLLCC